MRKRGPAWDWETGMTKSSLNLGQRQTVEIIEALGFGVIERLSIRRGGYEPEHRIMQMVKVDSNQERQLDGRHANVTLKKEIESLFDHLSRLRGGVVDI